jgi:hypothetical protein
MTGPLRAELAACRVLFHWLLHSLGRSMALRGWRCCTMERHLLSRRLWRKEVRCRSSQCVLDVGVLMFS